MRLLRVCCIALLALLCTYTILRWGEIFRVEGVRVVGVQHLSSQYVAQLTQIVLGANMLRLDLRGVRDEACRDPWVRDARVKRSFLSRTVEIRIAEREPVGRVQLEGGRTVWVDSEGVVLGAAAEEAALHGVRLKDGRVPTEAVSALRHLDRTSTALRSTFPHFDASDPDCVVARGPGRPQVLCGPIGTLPTALATLERLVEAPQVELEVYGRVDLRWGSRVILKP